MNTPYTRGAWILAFALAPWGTQARELTPVDALANAPIVARVKGSVALPDGVDRWSREERLGLPSFVWMKPASAAATTKFAVQAAPAAARAVLQQLAPAYGLSAQEVAAAPVHHRQTLASGAQRFCRSKAARLKSACVARLFKRPVSRTGWQRTRLCLVGSTALF